MKWRILIEPSIVLIAIAAAATSQDERICEHAGGGPTLPARVREATKLLADLDREFRSGLPRAEAPSIKPLPRCVRKAVRKRDWHDMPEGLRGKTLQIGTSDGLSPELARRLEVTCIPTTIRFGRDGTVEWEEK